MTDKFEDYNLSPFSKNKGMELLSHLRGTQAYLEFRLAEHMEADSYFEMQRLLDYFRVTVLAYMEGCVVNTKDPAHKELIKLLPDIFAHVQELLESASTMLVNTDELTSKEE